MTRPAMQWAAGAATSVLAHSVAGAGLVWALMPDPVKDQPTPTSQVQVETYQIDKTAAPEAVPDAQQADERPATGTTLNQGAIPSGKAAEATPDSTALPAESPQAQALAPTADPAQRLAAIADPAPSQAAAPAPATPVATSLAPADPVAAVPATSSVIAPSAAAADSVAPTEAPATAISSTVAPTAAVTASAAPSTSVAASVAQIPAVAALSAPAITVAANNAPAPAVATMAAPATTVAASVAPVPAVATLAPQAAPLATVQAAVLTVPSTLPPGTAPAEPVPVAAPTLAAVVAPTAPVTADQPRSASLAPSVPDAPAAPQLAPASEATAAAAPDATALPQATGNVTRATAELAFAGAEGVTDPISLAAVQSFTAPETLKPGEGLRDGLAGLLGSIPCSRLQVRFLPETNTLEVLGHIPDTDARTPLMAALQAQMGGDIKVSDNILILPRPQCQALSGIANVGLPQSTDQITNSKIVGADAQAREFSYSAGQQLVLDLTAPDYDAFVYVDYFDSGGQVIHLSPNDSVPLAATSAKQPLRIGADKPGDPGLYITIGPPFGQEIAVAFAASRPLYDGTRPLAEPAEPYLEFLAEKVRIARQEDPTFKGEWVYFFVTTSAN